MLNAHSLTTTREYGLRSLAYARRVLPFSRALEYPDVKGREEDTDDRIHQRAANAARRGPSPNTIQPIQVQRGCAVAVPTRVGAISTSAYVQTAQVVIPTQIAVPNDPSSLPRIAGSSVGS